jgi:hypothetical protein
MRRALERLEGWCEVIVPDGIDPGKSGIYEWRIEGVGAYVGKYAHLRRPAKEYPSNVTRLLNNLPYRRSKPDGFRRIHHELRAAREAGTKITLTFLENVSDAASRSRREAELIAERGSLNDPPFGRKSPSRGSSKASPKSPAPKDG